MGGAIDVHASASNTTQPAATASIVSGGCTSGYPGSGCAGGSYSSTSKIDYHIIVSGPNNVRVPFIFETAGGVVGAGTTSARVDLIAPGGLGLTGFNASTTSNGASTFCGSNGCVNGTQHVSLLSNTSYTIEVFASASASTNNVASVSAWADPYIYIDPTYVGGNQFALSISDGVGNTALNSVPEPSSLVMLLFGALCLRLAAFRRA